jgi:hypothetical protein
MITGVFNNSSSLSKPLKWKGSLPELCRLFYFSSKDHYEKTGSLCYFEATREEIEEFIYKNFVDEQGNFFTKPHITKIFNSNDGRMTLTHKRDFKKILKLDMPSNDSSEKE